MSQSGCATQELVSIINPARMILKEIFLDEPEKVFCRVCGEPKCNCDARTKARLHISEIFKDLNFQWMSKDVLMCDEHKLDVYAGISFFYGASEKFADLLKEAHIYNYAECGSCHQACTPIYLYGGKEPLCHSCAKEILN
jgi:hypothetical protein